MENRDFDLLREQFLNTDYIVLEPQFLLRIDKLHPKLDAFLQDNGHETWAFITAANPGAKPLPLSTNLQKQEELKDYLRKLNLTFFEGEGKSTNPHSQWQPEPSLLVTGISRAEAIKTAEVFKQVAIVFGEVHQKAELVWVSE